MLKSCVSALFVLFQSKWLNLPKSYVSALLQMVKSAKIICFGTFVFFYAKIMCFGTFCIIPVQMFKSAEIICFGTFPNG